MHRLSILSCVAASFCGCGVTPLTPRDPDPGAFHFVIETYNLNNEEEGNPVTTAAVGDANADVVCLQEVSEVWRSALESRYAARYPYRAFRPDPGGGAAGLGIMSRFPIRDGGFLPGPRGWHPSWQHLIDTPHGTFAVLNVHLRNAAGDSGNAVQSYLRTDADHLYEIKEFTARCADVMPMIVAGDFNEGTSGAAIRYLQENGFQNSLPLYHPGQPTWRYDKTVGGQFTQTIDHILFDDRFESLNAWVVNGGASDHLPVLAHLQASGDF
ncbi:MAG: endonuclease/exonuclease/phosphatase family protein [Polyangiaceae bacterium]